MVGGTTIDLLKEDGVRVVRVAGALSRDGLGLLEDILHKAEGPLKLDLSRVRLADDLQAELIRILRGAGVATEGTSPYPASLLGNASRRDLL